MLQLNTGSSGAVFTAVTTAGPFAQLPPVRRLSTKLSLADKCGDLAVRWSFRRNSWQVEPGVYTIGNPDRNSPVLVTANYRLTVNILRRTLKALDIWLLVLDTKGVNVWCAAGKGTFGTEEVINRVKSTGLSSFIDHRELVLPQLGAPGVAGYKVTQATGFKVVWGPVAAADVPAFLASGKCSTQQMRRVRFGVRERMAVAPVEIVQAWPFYLASVLLAWFTAFCQTRGEPHSLFTSDVLRYQLLLTGNVFAGTVLFPLLLPFLPFKAFAAKGAILAVLWSSGVLALTGLSAVHSGVGTVGAVLAGMAASSFLAMNLTGASTFTNQNGTVLEVKTSVPLQLASALVGIVLIGIQCARMLLAGGAV